MSDEDFYAVLGVSRDASQDDVRKAYRQLARKHHPDLNPGDQAAEDRFKRISAAYEVLNNEGKRALYDELGADAEKIGYDPERAEEYRQWKRRAEASAGFGGRGFGGFGGQTVDLEDLFGDLFGGGGRPRGPRKGRDIEASLRVPFRDAARGTSASVKVPLADGAKSLTVTVPAGVDDGQRLRLAGQGMPSPTGGPAGDLFVRIEVEDDRVFSRDGLDLSLTLPVTVAEAMSGAPVEVPTLGGTVRLRVPGGAQNGQRMRLRGKGIAPPKGPAGDLFVTLSVVLPTGGDPEERERLAKALEALYEENDVRALLREAGR